MQLEHEKGIPKPGESTKSPEELLQITHKQLADSYIHASGVFSDVRNIWTGAQGSVLAGYFDQLGPLEEYFQYMNRRWDGDPVALALVHSKDFAHQPTIDAFDKKVREFNTMLPQIIENKDEKTAMAIFTELERIVRSGVQAGQDAKAA